MQQNQSERFLQLQSHVPQQISTTQKTLNGLFTINYIIKSTKPKYQILSKTVVNNQFPKANYICCHKDSTLIISLPGIDVIPVLVALSKFLTKNYFSKGNNIILLIILFMSSIIPSTHSINTEVSTLTTRTVEKNSNRTDFQGLYWDLGIAEDSINVSQRDLPQDDISNRNIRYLNRHTMLNFHQTHQHSNIESGRGKQNILKKNFTLSINNSNNEKSENTYVPQKANDSLINMSECFSCKKREKAKLDNLESIKRHILMRLKLKQMPNITKVPVVPQIILDNFYKNPYNSINTATYSATTFARNTDDADVHITQLQSSQGEKMQGDDSKYVKDEFIDNHNIWQDCNLWDITDESLYSRLNNIYIFPNVLHLRHNRGTDILNFKFNGDASIVVRSILHLYIRGRDWMQKYKPKLLHYNLSNGTLIKRQNIIITIYRALKRPNSMNYTHTVKLTEMKYSIPNGLGQWIEIALPQLSFFWLTAPNIKQSLLVSGQESWMRYFIVTQNWANGKALVAHIELLTKERRRSKRSTSLDCLESDNEVRCCRYPLKVNFTYLGWNFIVAPSFFDAYFCNGECKAGYLEQYTHTHVTSLTTSATPCCSPRKMKSLTLLYFNDHEALVQTTIPNMSVDTCSCS